MRADYAVVVFGACGGCSAPAAATVDCSLIDASRVRNLYIIDVYEQSACADSLVLFGQSVEVLVLQCVAQCNTLTRFILKHTSDQIEHCLSRLVRAQHISL